MNTYLPCRIEKGDYFLNGSVIEQNFNFMERAEFFKNVTVKNDIYPDYSMIYRFENPVDRPVYAILGHNKIKLYSGVTFYAAPRCFIKWVYPKGLSIWKAYVYARKDAKSIAKECALLPGFDSLVLESSDEYIDILSDRKLIPLPFYHKKDVTRVLGEYLLDNFYEETDILEVYKRLGIPSSTAAYLFGNIFGVSPISFRNKLRVFEALKLISLGGGVQDACKKVGFASYTSFYRQFVSTLNAAPSDFLRYPHHSDAA